MGKESRLHTEKKKERVYGKDYIYSMRDRFAVGGGFWCCS